MLGLRHIVFSFLLGVAFGFFLAALQRGSPAAQTLAAGVGRAVEASGAAVQKAVEPPKEAAEREPDESGREVTKD